MPVIDRVAFTLAGVPVYWYGILMALAIALAVLTCMARERRLGLTHDTTLNLSLWVVPMGLIGARLYYVLFSLGDYIKNPLLIFDLRSGGLAIYGAVIAGVLTGIVYARVTRQPFWALADLVAPTIALGQAIGRWGNFVNQEAYGYAVADPALMWFPMSVFIEATGQWHLATFFYESVWCLLLCVALLIAERRRAFKRRGDLFLWYVMLYALERGLVEGLRTDSLMLGGLRVSQVLSMAACVICAIVLWMRRNTKDPENDGRPV